MRNLDHCCKPVEYVYLLAMLSLKGPWLLQLRSGSRVALSAINDLHWYLLKSPSSLAALASALPWAALSSPMT
eukprot:2365341-Rhodomonas_salina.1